MTNTAEKKGTIEVGKATPEQLEQWRNEHKLKKGEIAEIKVVDDRDELTVRYGYIRRPDKLHMSLALRNYRESKVLEAGETLISGGWVGGDETIKTDEYVYMSACVTVADTSGFLLATVTRL